MSQICLKIGRSIARSPQSSAMRLTAKSAAKADLYNLVFRAQVPLHPFSYYACAVATNLRVLGSERSYCASPFLTEHAQWVTVTK